MGENYNKDGAILWEKLVKFDEVVKSRKTVIPVKAGIQNLLKKLDSRLRGNDKKGQKRLFTRPSNFRLPDVGRVFAGNFGNGDGTFFCKNGKDMAG
jgi:hypothetical protein